MQIPSKYLPSKQFVKIACGALVVIFIIYMVILYKKTYTALKNPAITTSTVPVQTLLDKDTDNDGVKDWEEALWGTDISNPKSFGVPDNEYIAQKRKMLDTQGEIGAAGSQNLNDTEKIAREFLTTIVSLKESGNLNAFNIGNLATKFSTDVGAGATLQKKYTATDITTGADTIASKKAYYDKVSKAIAAAKTGGMGTELSVIAKYFSAGDTAPTDSSQINKLATIYTTLTKSLKSISAVPPSAVQMQLDFLNEADNMASIFKNISQIGDNSIVGLVAVAQFQNNEPAMEKTLASLITYFKASGIIK